MIDDVRQFWDRWPCNISHGRERDLKENPYQYSAQVTAKKYRVEPHIPIFAQFNRWAGWSVLDLGCGIGTDSLSFARIGSKVLGVDISCESLKVARKRAKAESLEASVDFEQHDIETLDLSWNPLFDLIYSFGAIHHTPNPRLAILSARKYIKPYGEFRFMVYNRYSWKVLWIFLKYGKGRFWRWKDLVRKHSEAQIGCPVTWTFTKKSLRKMLGECGFEVTDIWVDHIFPYRVPDYIRGRYVKEWYWRWMPPRLFRWLERHFGWHLMVVARPI